MRHYKSYEEMRGKFAWDIPSRYNIGVDIVDRHADVDPFATALIYESAAGEVVRYTFQDLKRLSNRLANALAAKGVRRGDRVAVLLPQSVETIVGHVAAYKLGAIALPLFTQFGPEALHYRLTDSGAKALITNAECVDKIMAMRADLPDLGTVLLTGNDKLAGVDRFDELVAAGHEDFEPEDTAPDDPALIIYTSGTTGNPKGALHGHRVLLGHLPGVELPHNFFPRPGDLFWTPADWAWIGGLIDVLLPSLHHKVPVLARRGRKFDPEEAFALMARHNVRNAFLPPTALKLMRQVPQPKQRYGYALRSIGSGGETLGEELMQWGRETFGLDINEFYGQTECNLIVGNCGELMPIRLGSMGRAIPGHEVGIVDDDGTPLADGMVGNIAVRKPDPVMFLGYWNNPRATTDKFAGDWLLTGDTGRRDEEGYFWFSGRSDDVITSAGYRIGPAEVEDTLIRHPAVAMAAVIGKPDPVRTEIVKAFIVLARPDTASDALRDDIQDFVRQRLAAYEYPREIEFVDELPMTATGKIMRRELRMRERGQPEK